MERRRGDKGDHIQRPRRHQEENEATTAAPDLNYGFLDFPALEARESWVERQRFPNERFEHAFLRLQQQSVEEIRTMMSAIVGNAREFHGPSNEGLCLWVADGGRKWSIYSNHGRWVLRQRWLVDQRKMNDEESILTHALMGERRFVRFFDARDPYWHYTARERLHAVREMQPAPRMLGVWY